MNVLAAWQMLEYTRKVHDKFQNTYECSPKFESVSQWVWFHQKLHPSECHQTTPHCSLCPLLSSTTAHCLQLPSSVLYSLTNHSRNTLLIASSSSRQKGATSCLSLDLGPLVWSRHASATLVQHCLYSSTERNPNFAMSVRLSSEWRSSIDFPS